MAILALTACRAIAPGAVVPTSEPPAAEPAPRVTPEPSPCFLGGGVADVIYTDISEYARLAETVSIAKVVAVSDLRYSTESGARPSCDYLQDAQGVVSVGRLIDLQEVRSVGGKGRPAETLTYWLAGGSLDGDTTPPHHFGLEVPDVGDQMLAFVLGAPIDVDPGADTLEVQVFELMAIGRDGRIQTPNPKENLTTEVIGEVLEEAVPSP